MEQQQDQNTSISSSSSEAGAEAAALIDYAENALESLAINVELDLGLGLGSASEHKDAVESIEASLLEVELALQNVCSGELQQEPEKLSAETAVSEAVTALLQQISELPDCEQKLAAVIAFMEQTLSQTATPHFKTFWEARNLCLELFKENINATNRLTLWAKYQELSKEARRLKELYDEQSQFAAEQIDIAIKALETDIEQFTDILDKMPPSNFPQMPDFLRANLTDYDNLQKEIDLLNVQAVRVGALRKELLKTEMRIRVKNKFFQRLSSIGDKIFPRRKEIIKELSTQFTEDVEIFVSRYFGNQVIRESLFVLREGIKALQCMAKALALNTSAFTVTRKRLSECWDALKELERNRKKERNQKKTEWETNTQTIQQHLETLQLKSQELPLNAVEVNRLIDETTVMIRKLEVGRDNLASLRQKFNDIRTPVLEQIKEQEQQKQHAATESIRLKKQSIQDLRQQLENALRSVDQTTVEALNATISKLSDSLHGLGAHKTEKTEMERLLKRLRDALTEKQESSFLSLSEDDAKDLQQIKEVLKQRKERRREMKEQLDHYRKSSGASGLDFEQAILFNEHIRTEKERIEKIDLGIKEIEQRIAERQRQAHSRT